MANINQEFVNFNERPERFIKGKRNKLKIGQKVMAKERLVNWFTNHLSWCAGQPVHNDSAYAPNQLEIKQDKLQFTYMWTYAKLSGKMPTGIITHYGASDDTVNKYGQLDRKNVYVDFKLKTSFGIVKYSCYVHESDLSRLVQK